MADWTKAEIDRLKTYWAAGLSAIECARVLKGDGHPKRTRNAIIGKVHRLKLPSRLDDVALESRRANAAKARAAKRGHKVRTCRPPKPARVIAPPPAPAAAADPDSLNLSFAHLEPRQCRYITQGAGADARYCGHTGEGVWCRHHRAVVYQPHTKPTKRFQRNIERWAEWMR